MKTLYLYAIALLATFAVPALADTKIVLGCEVTDKGGYLNKVDPTCQFSHNPARGKVQTAGADGISGTADDVVIPGDN